ncbi:MAG: uroporphyrinogen-III synthase [Alphaproteobacteria bacterium]|nr:uroporphyrinogen-III synthase [Alphaproteobacteria bacterium]
MRLLNTRPEADGAALDTQLRALGHTAIAAPLLTIVFKDGPPLSLEGVQALLLTSANGARALARRTDRRDLPVLAVGEQTAAAARGAGFSDVHSAGGDVAALAQLVRARLDPGGGPLVHVAAEIVAGDLAAALTAHGFSVRRETLYRAVAAEQLPANALAALREKSVEGALFFSPRTAAHFAALVDRAGVAAASQDITAFALSDAVADALRPLRFRAVAIAARPDLASLLALLPPGAASRERP